MRHSRRGRIGEVGEERVEVIKRGLPQLLQDVVGVRGLRAVGLHRQAAHEVGQLRLRQLAQRARHLELQLRRCLATRGYRVLETPLHVHKLNASFLQGFFDV